MENQIVCYCNECIYHNGDKGCKLMQIVITDGQCFEYQEVGMN